MNKQIRLMVLLFAICLLFPQAALAGGWLSIGDIPNADIDSSSTPNNGLWASNVSPHLGFATATNQCKVCHAVHDGNADSYRLLRNNSRLTECDWCHDATSGATALRPYDVGTYASVRGEHTLGATSVPDADTSTISNSIATEGLMCGHCHSVHSANSIGYDVDNDGNLDPVALTGQVYTSDDGVENWNSKILRVDPSGDGVALAIGTGGLIASQIEGTATSNRAAVRTGFCADCHARNPNWAMTNADTDRPNKTSHPQGPGLDGLMEVYGDTSIAVALHLGESQGCRGCHTASDGQDVPGDSSFPHQSVGWKLLFDTYTSGGVASAGDPERDLPSMDKVCLYCHPIQDIETYGGYAEVEEAACYRCHNIVNEARYGIGAPDLESQFAKASGHPTPDYSGRHSNSEWTDPVGELGIGNRHAECVDCHNMERVIQGLGRPLRGAWGVSVANAAAGTSPTFTKVDGASFEYEVCFKCHSSYTTRPASNYYEYPVGTPVGPQSDKAIEFNPNNNAFHPVESNGRNQSSNLNAQLAAAGLTTGSTIKCSDCHNSDDTSDTVGPASNSASEPKGPHGSDTEPVLRANYLLGTTGSSVGPASWVAENFALCFLCHDETALTARTAALGAKTNFYKNGALNRNLHWVHLKDLTNRPIIGTKFNENAVCRDCHYNSHSNQQAPNTAYGYLPDGGSWTTGLTTPPDGVKTHLVNFAPELDDVGGGGTPNWVINLDPLDGSLVPVGGRSCQLRCHLNKGGSPSYKEMDLSSHYYNPPSGDDVPTY